jgi:hypothetical protein
MTPSSLTLSQRLLLLLLFSLIALTLLGPLTSNFYLPNVADYVDHISLIIQAKLALAEGQFPLRVAPVALHGWQYPIYQFYSPLAYTFAGSVYRWLTPASPFIAYKFSIWFCLTLGAIYLYRTALWLTRTHAAALLASVAYLFAPYLILTVNRWAGLTESMALGILPIALFYSIRCLTTESNLRALLFAALAWFALITIHLITFIYASLFIGLWMLLLKITTPYPWKNLLWTGVAYIYGYLLAVWFLAPIELFADLLAMKKTMTDPGTFSSITSLASLFSVTHLIPSFTTDEHIPFNTPVHPAIGWPILLAVGTALYAWCTRQPIQDARAQRLMKPLLILFFVALFMVWSPLPFWSLLPQFLLIGQFCFRLLSQVMWLGALLFAWTLCWAFKDKLSTPHVIVGLLLIGLAGSSWFPPENSSRRSMAELVKDPVFIMAKSAYLLMPALLAKQVPVHIDSMPIISLVNSRGELIVGSEISYSTVMLMDSPKANLNIAGTSPTRRQIIVRVNGSPSKPLTLEANRFSVNIPLGKLVLPTKAKTFTLQFLVTPSQPPIALYDIALSNLEPHLNLMPVSQVQPHCKRNALEVTCQITAKPDANFIELPIVYYPQLIDVTANGKSIDYQAVVSGGQTFAAVHLTPNVPTALKIRFRGLVWANWLSAIAWILLLALLVYTFFEPKKTEF